MEVRIVASVGVTIRVRVKVRCLGDKVRCLGDKVRFRVRVLRFPPQLLFG